LKILIIRFSSIGDIVLTTPVIRMAKLQLGAEVHYLSKIQYAEILEPNPYIDQLFLLNNNLKSILSALEQEQYDLIIDLHHNLRTFRVKRALKIPSRSFFKANLEKWLMVNFKVNRLPSKHIVERYLETLGPYGVHKDDLGLDFFFNNDVDLEPFSLPERYVVISLGGAHATKQVPFEKLDALVQTKTWPIVLIGGKDVVKSGQELKRLNPEITDLTGKVSLNISAKIIENSIGLITGDTGMMHIGAALGKKMFVLWGNTIPEFGMYPYYGRKGERHINWEIKLSCRPCSKTGHKKCPKGHFRCMMDHDVKKIGEAADSFF
jgi:ADP-heptose:LPS heptosyltransferase